MRRRILIQSMIIATLSALIVFFAALGTHYGVSEQKIKQDIQGDTAILSDLLETDVSILDSVKSFGEVRVTLVDMEGNVVFDSAKGDSGSMDNHTEREEIKAAISGNPKVVRRYSETLGTYMYYYAETVGDDYVLRLAERAANIWSFTGMGILYVTIAVIVAWIVAFILASRLSDKVEKQLKGLRDGLRNINQGVYTPVEYEDKDSLNLSILSEMNELMGNLRDSYNAIETEKSKLSAVINNMTQGIVVLDSEYNISLVNSVAEDIFGKVNIGDNIICLIPDLKLHDRIISALKDGNGELFHYEYQSRDLMINVFTVDGVNGGRLSVILISDVTLEREVARQKSMFFANASHELKTPLTSMRGLSEVLLSKTSEDDPSYKYIKRIHTESVRLHRIVMDMLYINRLETRSIDQRSDSIDIAALCNEAIEEYRGEIETKALTVTVSGNADICADERNMYECINNIIGNAIHYNKENGRVDISLDKRAGRVILSVADTGIGIAEEHLPHICERFYRVDKSRSKLTGGTGLGLSIVKYIVALYGGTLDISSKVGVGTTVTVSFETE